jgi:hypothetical protein
VSRIRSFIVFGLALCAAHAVGKGQLPGEGGTDANITESGGFCGQPTSNILGYTNHYVTGGCIEVAGCPPCQLNFLNMCQEGCAMDSFTTELGTAPVSQSDWLFVTAACNGVLTVDTCDTAATSTLDAVLGLYSGCEAPSLCNLTIPLPTAVVGDTGLLEGNDEGCVAGAAGGGGLIARNVSLGDTFLLRIAGYGGQGSPDGEYTLTVDCSPTQTDPLSSMPGQPVSGAFGGGTSTVGGVTYSIPNGIDAPGDLSADFAELPSGYQPLLEVNFTLASDPAPYWNVSFTGSFTAPMELTFAYDVATLTVPESLLQIWHYDGTGWSALPVITQNTTSLPHTITVQTTSLSPFVLGGNEVVGDPVPAVSTWGLMCLCLVLLASGTLVLRQRRNIV